MKHKMKYLHTMRNKYGPAVIVFECRNCDYEIIVEQMFWQEATIGGLGWRLLYNIDPCSGSKMEDNCKNCFKPIRWSNEHDAWYHYGRRNLLSSMIHAISCGFVATPK